MKKKPIIITAIVLLVTVLLYFIFLPAINFHSFGFVLYFSLILGYIVGIVLFLTRDKLLAYEKSKGRITYNIHKVDSKTGKLYTEARPIEEKYQYPNLIGKGVLYTIGAIICLSIVLQIAGSKLFSSKSYANQLTIENASQEEFKEAFNFTNDDVLLPMIDKDIAFKLAQQKLSTYGAQYTLDSDNFTIISVNRDGKDQLLRVAPLEYSGFFVALNRYNKGTIGYIEVNVVTQETRLVEVESGMKYMPSAILFKNLNFYFRMHYPSAMYTEKYFEIDDEGNPYWVIPTYTNEIALYNGKMPNGVVLLNPCNGETTRYEIGEEPSWVDRVVDAEVMETQANNSLKYQNGFFNATFGQKENVFQVSDGYNYFIKDGHTYYVSCITSPNESDQTSIGFITIDLKTKVAKQYAIDGLTEMRAREIAMQHEDVKAQELVATWPILIDYKGIPTYFLVLKNDVQVRKVVLMDVDSGQFIAMGSNLQEAKDAYDKKLNTSSNDASNVKTIEGVIIDKVILDNELYFKLEGVDASKYFVVNVKLNADTIFCKVGEKVSLTYTESSDCNYVKTFSIVDSAL